MEISSAVQLLQFIYDLCDRVQQAYDAVQSNAEEATELRERISNVQAVLKSLGPALEAARDERQAWAMGRAAGNAMHHACMPLVL